MTNMLWITRPARVDYFEVDRKIEAYMETLGLQLTDTGMGFGQRDLGYQSKSAGAMEIVADERTLESIKHQIALLGDIGLHEFSVRVARDS